MSVYNSDRYKKLCRAMTVITKGAERCFDNPDIEEVVVYWADLEWRLGLLITIDTGQRVKVIADSVESAEKALDDFLEKLCTEINEIVTLVESQEQEVRNDIEQYGRVFGGSPLLVLSGLKAWRMIVESFTRFP